MSPLKGPWLYCGTPKVLTGLSIACVNDTKSFDTNYQRFLVNRLRERLPYSEVPIRLLFRTQREQRYTRDQR